MLILIRLVLSDKSLYCLHSSICQTYTNTIGAQRQESTTVSDCNACIHPYVKLLYFIEDTEEILLKAKESSKRAASLLMEKMLKSTDEGKWATFVIALQKEGNLINVEGILISIQGISAIFLSMLLAIFGKSSLNCSFT